MSETAMPILGMDSRARLAGTMHRLLHRLRRYVEAVPMMADDKMPEHRVTWVSYPGSGGYEDGPEQVILQALKEHPELWLQAVPAECCIVTRRALERDVGREAAEIIAGYGENAVLHHACVLRADREQRERRKAKE